MSDREAPLVVVSGGFDPLHVGHLRMMREAAKLGDLWVLVNTDEWLRRKKCRAFMPWHERAEIISELRFVRGVVEAKDDDDSVVASLRDMNVDYFVNSGDRNADNTPETEFCVENGIEVKFIDVGEVKDRSSSVYLEDYMGKKA